MFSALAIALIFGFVQVEVIGSPRWIKPIKRPNSVTLIAGPTIWSPALVAHYER